MTHRVAVSAHRGGVEYGPHGTLAAFQGAADGGAEYVEFDVRRTLDGQLVVYHDHRAERRGLVPHVMTRAALERGLGRDVPSLQDVLDALAGKAKGHIDIKETGYEAEVVAAALDTLGAGNFVVTAEDASLRAVKRAYPETFTALSLGRGPFDIPLSRTLQARTSEFYPLRRMRACGADGVALHHRLARAGTLRIVARYGIPAMIWTVNHPPLIRRLVHDPRVTVLVTDHPEVALAARAAGPRP